MQRRPKPILYAAFANDLVDPAHGLDGLAEESSAIAAAMAPLTGPDAADAPWQLLIDPGCTPDSLVSTFSSEQVTIFHYAGHANPEKIMLQSATGGKQIGSAEKLEDFLARQTNLRLVFLNACSTQAWAQRLVQLGVPCVIATSCPIQDILAPKFAKAFYQAMVKASGPAAASTIQQAFDSAVAGIGVSDETALRDIDIPADDPTPTGQPWAIYTQPKEDAASWTLALGANDPLIGLPPLDHSYYDNLPPSPYVSIQGHTPADAALFFGRNGEIAALYTWILDPTQPPIRLFYGQSGAGKSSLLQAGLLPRLAGLVEVTYIRRTANLNLVLQSAIGAESDDQLLQWLTHPQPRLLIFDQVEEAITQKPAVPPGSATPPDELTTFLIRLIQIFSLVPHPTARIILSFRKEYLAEIQSTLAQNTPDNAPPLRQNFWLERLDTDAIIQVVEGPIRSAALRQRYNLTIASADLAPTIAADLTRDSHSSIATILEIILVKLWELACAAAQPPVYTTDLYTENSVNPLQDFFTEEMAAVLATPAGQSAAGGLQLDLLYEHTTALVTSRARTLDQLRLCYPLVKNLEDLLRLNTGHLLTSFDTDTTALAHDTLASIIRREYELSILPGSRARRLLENRARDWHEPLPKVIDPTAKKTSKYQQRKAHARTFKKQGDPLDSSDLKVVEAGLAQMRAPTPAERLLIEASRIRRHKQAFRQRAAALLLFVLGVLYFMESRVTNVSGLLQKAETDTQPLDSLADVLYAATRIDHSWLLHLYPDPQLQEKIQNQLANHIRSAQIDTIDYSDFGLPMPCMTALGEDGLPIARDVPAKGFVVIDSYDPTILGRVEVFFTHVIPALLTRMRVDYAFKHRRPEDQMAGTWFDGYNRYPGNRDGLLNDCDPISRSIAWVQPGKEHNAVYVWHAGTAAPLPLPPDLNTVVSYFAFTNGWLDSTYPLGHHPPPVPMPADTTPAEDKAEQQEENVPGIAAIALAPGGRRLAVVSSTGTARVFDWSKMRQWLLGYVNSYHEADAVVPPFFSAQADFLIQPERPNHTVAIWPLLAQPLPDAAQPILLPDATTAAIFAAPRGHILATGGPGGVYLYWISKTSPVPVLLYHYSNDANVTAIAFNPDGGLLAFGDDKGLITVLIVPRNLSFRVETDAERLAQLEGKPTPPDRKSIDSGLSGPDYANDFTEVLKYYHSPVKKGEEFTGQTVQAYPGKVFAIAFSRDSRILSTLVTGSILDRWSILRNDNEFLRIMPGPGSHATDPFHDDIKYGCTLIHNYIDRHAAQDGWTGAASNSPVDFASLKKGCDVAIESPYSPSKK